MIIFGIPLEAFILLVLVVILSVLFLIWIKPWNPANVCPPAGQSHLNQYLRTLERPQISSFKTMSCEDKLYRHLLHIQNFEIMVLNKLDDEEQSHLDQIKEEARILWKER